MSRLNNPTLLGQNLGRLNTIKLDSDELLHVIGSQQWEQFLNRHHLEAAYLEQAVNHYYHLVLAILRQQQRLDRPLIVGINGAQGSGKSTLADWLVTVLSALLPTAAVALSIDDFYLARERQDQLVESVHLLLATRGVPGTHDISLALDTLAQLGRTHTEIAVPRFDKSRDDRYPSQHWSRVCAPVSVVVLEGWCLGVTAQDDAQLEKPVNDLERIEDSAGIWRQYANRQLRGDYQQLWEQVDIWVMLRAPGFSAVYDWRLEQERKLAVQMSGANGGHQAGNRLMDEGAIARFIQFYQRLTEHALKVLPSQVDFLYELDRERQIVAIRCPQEGSS